MLIWSDHVLLGDHHSGLRVVPAALQLSGARIVSVVPCDRDAFRAMVADGDDERLDLSGKLITPAFVNAHAHLPMAVFRGIGGHAAARDNLVEQLFYRLESELTDEDIRAFARMGAYECLSAGVAVVWEHYYGGVQLAQGLREAGIAGFVAPTLQDLDGPGVERLDAQLQATLDIMNDAESSAAGIYAALGPHATDTVSASLWRAVTELALKHDLTVHAHLAQSVEELARAHQRHGASPVQWLESEGALEARGLWVHGIFLSDADLGRFDASRHTLGFCPFSQLQFSFPADVLAWERAGLPWLVATDCAACNDGMGPQKELRFVAGLPTQLAATASLRERFASSASLADAQALQDGRSAAFDQWPNWRSSEHLLSRVWSIPGALDPRMRSGVLAPGAAAHLLTWDISHPSMWPHHDLLRAVALSEPGQALDGVMVNGGWWAKPGELADRLHRDDYREARREANERLTALLSRFG